MNDRTADQDSMARLRKCIQMEPRSGTHPSDEDIADEAVNVIEELRGMLNDVEEWANRALDTGTVEDLDTAVAVRAMCAKYVLGLIGGARAWTTPNYT